MGRQSAIRIDFVRRKRQDGTIRGSRRQPVERRQKKPHVVGCLFEVGIARNDVKNQAFLTLVRGAGDKQRLCRRSKAGDCVIPRIEAAARNRCLEKGSQIQRRRGCGHQCDRFLIVSRMRVVE